jgi:arylformamidase
MKHLTSLLVGCAAILPAAQAQILKSDIPYTDSTDKLQTLDVYTKDGAKNLPVIVWIHGGGWQTGDKAQVKEKPKAFVDKGFVFVSVNYRLLPAVDMTTIVRDVAKSVHWVHDHIAEYGGDPKRLFVMGHSAGAQLAALICTDNRYLKNEGLSFAILKGCVPVDGDTYNIPLMITTALDRRKAAGQPPPTYGHREKFGTPEQHIDFSAITHVKPGKGIPPFLVLHVADHVDTTTQANQLGDALKKVGIPVKVFGGQNTNHNKLNDDLGVPDDAATKELFEFVESSLKG